MQVIDDSLIKAYHKVMLTSWKFMKDRLMHFDDSERGTNMFCTDAFWETTIKLADEEFDAPFRNTPVEAFAGKQMALMMNEISRIEGQRRKAMGMMIGRDKSS